MTSAAGGKARCAICGKPAAAGFRPFCSRRCADIDLQRWLAGVYVVVGDAEGAGAEPEGIKPEGTDSEA